MKKSLKDTTSLCMNAYENIVTFGPLHIYMKRTKPDIFHNYMKTYMKSDGPNVTL